jgi:predicted RNA-binding protein YlxR (DUF448 family)/ribosomal protein L30E
LAPRTNKRSDDTGEASLRRCIASGQVRPKEDMLRFVVGPENDLVPDLEGRLPGRGLWLSADRDVVNTACAGNHFAKAARRQVTVPDDLFERVDSLLARRCLDLIGLARRAGDVAVGFEKVRARLAKGGVAIVLAARDGADGGRDKVRALAPRVPVIDLFTAAELGAVMGRPHAVHVVVDEGGLAKSLLRQAKRLAALRRPTTDEN